MTRTASHATSAERPHDGFVVASSCPRCGAPLDFAEGTNAVRCVHCASLLLVTGRRRVLSWVVRARVSPAEARKQAAFARAAGTATRDGAPRLLYVPYYRLSAEEVFWRRARPRPRPQLERLDAGALADESGRLLRLVAGARDADDDPQLELASRAIERSFLACDLGSLASWSLGVRSGVLRLELFQRDALAAEGTVLSPTVGAEAALARALVSPSAAEAVHRDVLRVVLSLVYFPLWVVPGEPGRASVVDAITGSLIARDADAAPLAALAERAPPPEHVVGFRALCCPNCGWDFALRAADVVFHCASCARTWELRGEELEPITSAVVVAPERDPSGTAVPHLPVWEVSGRVRAVVATPHRPLPERLFAPAFRWRALDHLCDLGVRLARGAPAAPELETAREVPLVGCSLDRDDALVLARAIALALLFEDANVRAGVVRGKAVPEVALDAAASRLVWLPFAGDAYSVCDPFTGYALPRRAVAAVVE